LAALALFIVGAVPPAESGPLLQGGVVHAEELGPLDPDLKPGKRFQNMPPAPQSSRYGRWYRIPNWYAGIWHREFDTRTFEKDYLTGKSSKRKWLIKDRCNARHGHQMDSTGQIWECADAMGQGIAEGEDEMFYQNVVSYQPVEVTQNKVVFKVLLDLVVVGKQTQVILNAKQTENIQEYTVGENPNVLMVEASMKTFDADGRPVSLEVSHTELSRIGAFEPKEKDPGGRDLHTLFKSYLQANGLTRLMPP